MKKNIWLLILFFGVFPLVAGEYYVNLASQIFIFAIFAASINLLLGYGGLPVCISKTQFSLSDNPEKLGRPRGFRLRVRGAEVSAGAGFVVAYAGDLISLPGLPEKPAAERIDVNAKGEITGLV